ncbi:methyl-accepting chemotaxis protein [Stappia sp.]|jgi:methyl-accepting chemotaxis protein|uniref:methyl-accepting chemotaxis protein n=1 Tax=Stappia sp. TaxID=1870903 RepID=UPI003D149491
MFRFGGRKVSESEAIRIALDKSQARIEFSADGTILDANQNFLDALGYRLDEIIGNHHSMFVDKDYARSSEYSDFWKRLGRGEYQAGQFKRFDKEGVVVWIEASYNPILAANGSVLKIIKFASDVTSATIEAAEMKGQVEAINKVSAVISFDLDGTITDANPNFLGAVGYRLEEIVGNHHGMFVDDDYRKSADYREFWRKLRGGEFQAGQFRRYGKDGKEIWIEASYNPILTPDGKPYKIIKFATDITAQMKLLQNLQELIHKNFADVETALSRTDRQAETVAGAADQTSDHVQALASSAEELAASIAEISQNMSRSRVATESAAEHAKAAEAATEKLVSAATAMGGIVGLIQDIAGQINLLALNATIESARAGEAGRGFAVVASEVKNLAGEAAKATDQIAREIDGVQTVTSDVVMTLENIRGAVDTVFGQVAAAASAVEEQSVVTSGMSESMHQVAAAVGAISGSITEIGDAVTQIDVAFKTTKEAATVLAR